MCLTFYFPSNSSSYIFIAHPIQVPIYINPDTVVYFVTPFVVGPGLVIQVWYNTCFYQCKAPMHLDLPLPFVYTPSHFIIM